MIRLILALSLASASLTAGQAVEGMVVDPAGAAVPHAAVSLTSNSGTGFTARTNDDGGFHFSDVPPGQYVLAVKAGRFTESTQTVLVDSKPLTVKVELAIASAAETVSVSAQSSRLAEQSIDPERNADRLNFDEQLLESLPAPGGDTINVVTAFLSPAAQGAESATIMVDGVETSAAALPASAIRRLRINRNPYSPQFRRPGKARVDVYTEEGSVRRLRGGFGITARNSLFDARNTFAPLKSDMDRMMFDGNFTGPVVRNRSSYYVNLEHYTNNDMAVVNARTLAGPVRENVLTPERRTRVLGRFETKGEGHQTSVQYGWLNLSDRNHGTGGLKLAEQGVPSSTVSHRLQFSDRALLFNRLLNDVRAVGHWESAERGAAATGAAIQVHGAFTGGAAQTFWNRRESSVRIQDIATITLSRHTIRFGAEGRPGFYTSMEQSQFGGTYEFASLDALAQRRALLYRVNRGDPHVSLTQHEAFGFIQDEAALAPGFNVNYGVRYGWQSDVGDLNNFAPRAGFAYSPGKSAHTVIRGGAGVFHERITEDVRRRSLLWDGIGLQELVYPNVSYPIGDPSTSAPPSNIVRSPGLVAPQLIQGSVALEQQIQPRTTLAVEYQHLRGTHLLRSRNANAPGTGGLRPDPVFQVIQQIESSASMQSDSLALTLRGAAGKYVTGMVQYTLASSHDDTGGPFWYPADSYNPHLDWARSDYDQRHRFNSAATLALGKTFRLGTFVSVASERPYTVTTGRDNDGDTIVNDRPAGLARNTGAGRAFAQLDLRFTCLLRAPRFLDRARRSTSRNVELSMDAFNVFNHSNYTGFSGVLTSPFFGAPTAAMPPRVIQFSIRYKL